jgi:hypothetical protein
MAFVVVKPVFEVVPYPATDVFARDEPERTLLPHVMLKSALFHSWHSTLTGALHHLLLTARAMNGFNDGSEIL